MEGTPQNFSNQPNASHALPAEGAQELLSSRMLSEWDVPSTFLTDTELLDLGFGEDISHPPDHLDGATQNAVPPKKEADAAHAQLKPNALGKRPDALANAAEGLDTDENMRIACAAAAAVRGAIAEGSAFETVDDKTTGLETATLLKSTVVEPAAGSRKRSLVAMKCPAVNGERAAADGGAHPRAGSDDHSSSSTTSKPPTATPGARKNAELGNIHELKHVAPTVNGAAAAVDDNGKPRSSQYRGVTKHKRSGRWEAHIWVKETGKQMYLGGYEKEEHAAEAYDVAAMKCKGGKAGRKVKLNFHESKYAELSAFMESVGLEELVMAIRRQSQGFARGSSGYRGVTHHPNGRWEARIGMPGSKHIYLGLFNEEAAAARAYDRALVRLRGASAATNYSLANYKSELQAFEMDKSTMNLTAASVAETLKLPPPPKSETRKK